MARTKIDYGIDLGTTNSAIARMEKGSPIIKKSITGSTQTDTTSSVVSYNKNKKIFVGNKAYRILGSERLSAFRKNDKTLINSFAEFKRDIGSDKQYECNDSSFNIYMNLREKAQPEYGYYINFSSQN